MKSISNIKRQETFQCDSCKYTCFSKGSLKKHKKLYYKENIDYIHDKSYPPLTDFSSKRLRF